MLIQNDALPDKAILIGTLDKNNAPKDDIIQIHVLIERDMIITASNDGCSK